jgi:hypothetical protein
MGTLNAARSRYTFGGLSRPSLGRLQGWNGGDTKGLPGTPLGPCFDGLSLADREFIAYVPRADRAVEVTSNYGAGGLRLRQNTGGGGGV